MKKYGIKEIFGTLQGEGGQAGTPSVFVRFAGCNLGYEVCPWCDTDWAKADLTLDCEATVEHVSKIALETFGRSGDGLTVVVTGGEPSLQFDAALSDVLRAHGYRIAMESNGSRHVDRNLVDWLTISPKQREFVQKDGNELKLVYTGQSAEGITPALDAVVEIAHGTDFDHYFLQPVDIPDKGGPNFEEAVQAVMRLGPPWRLSVQTHKVAGLR
jgi:7-carboxy-7-deazaguanine synthase